MNLNLSVFNWLHSFAFVSKGFDTFVIFMAVYFGYILIAGTLAFLFFHHDTFKKRFYEIALVFFSSGLAWFVSKILKMLFATTRPFVGLSDVHALFAESGGAFPSGHTTFFFALAFAIYFYHKKAGYIFMIGALLIGIARIIAGVHYPIDILGGMVLGSLISYTIYRQIRAVA